MSVNFLNPPLSARRGAALHVLIVARISGENQDEKSLDDQRAMIVRWLKQHYEGHIRTKVIATRGSGERLDRKEFKKLRRLIRSGRLDVVIAEDLGRFCRRVDAFKICESCEDHDTRLIALNDHIDTAQESWRMASFFAAMRHEQYNADTAKRIRRSLRNRFTQGGVVQTVIFCYEKSENCKSDADLKKIPEMETVVEKIFEWLENDWSYSEVARCLNEQQVPTGKWCRSKQWTVNMVRRTVFNPILKGVRVRNMKMAKRVNRTGRHKSVNAPPEERLERFCPHLAFVSAERFDQLIAKLTEKNAHFRAGKNGKVDHRVGRAKKKTVWPGQCVDCGICGHSYVYGGHGRNKHLMCSGAKQYKCWNGVSFDGISAAIKLGDAVFQAIADIPDFDEAYCAMIRDVAAERDSSRTGRRDVVADKLIQCRRKVDNIVKAISDTGGMSSLYEQLKQLEEEHKLLEAQLRDIDQEPQSALWLPSPVELRHLAVQSFEELSRESYAFAKLMNRLINRIVVYPYRSIDGGDVVLRAKFRLSLVPLAPQLQKLPNVSSLFTRDLTVDLFDAPQRVSFRERAVALLGEGIYQRDVAKALAITQPAVQNCLKLDQLMQVAGITDPYLPLTEPPADYNTLRRHKHARYRFEPKQSSND